VLLKCGVPTRLDDMQWQSKAKALRRIAWSEDDGHDASHPVSICDILFLNESEGSFVKTKNYAQAAALECVFV
jgi:hypothetical protein